MVEDETSVDDVKLEALNDDDAPKTDDAMADVWLLDGWSVLPVVVLFLLGEVGKLVCKEALDVTVETSAEEVGDESDKDEEGEKREDLSGRLVFAVLDVSEEVEDIMKNDDARWGG